MIPIEKLLGMDVVTATEGRRLGVVEGLEVAPADGRARYLRLKGDGHRGGFLPWASIQAIGDVVLVSRAAALAPELTTEERAGLTSRLGDRPVLTESGTQLGTVTSYDLDETTGQIERYRVTGSSLVDRLTHQVASFPRSAIRTFGPDAIIVADTLDAPAADETAANQREVAAR